jgi:hypothetical protein
MIPFLPVLAARFPLIWKARKLIAYGLAALAVAWALWAAIDGYGDRRASAEKAAVMARWAADKAAVKAAADAQIEAAAQQELEAHLHNNEVLADANAKLLAIAADRDSLAARLRDNENRLRRGEMSRATDQRGLDALAGVAARAAEIDRLYDAYDRACRSDAVRFQALQDELRPQIASK